MIKQQIILELIVPFLMYFWFCFKFVFCGWMFLLHRNGYDMWWQTYSKVWSDSCSVDVCFQLHQFHPVRKTTTRHWLSNGFVCYFHEILVVLKKERSKIQSEWCLGCVLLTRTWFYIHVQYCEMYHFPWSIDLTRGTQNKTWHGMVVKRQLDYSITPLRLPVPASNRRDLLVYTKPSQMGNPLILHFEVCTCLYYARFWGLRLVCFPSANHPYCW